MPCATTDQICRVLPTCADLDPERCFDPRHLYETWRDEGPDTDSDEVQALLAGRYEAV